VSSTEVMRVNKGVIMIDSVLECKMLVYLLRYKEMFTVVFYITKSNSREEDPLMRGLRRVVFACFKIAPAKHTLWHSDAHIQDPKRALTPS
jgi:hypothetical protein